MKCPKCGGECERDEVDNGVGIEACGPWGCPDCHWFETRESDLCGLDLSLDVNNPQEG